MLNSTYETKRKVSSLQQLLCNIQSRVMQPCKRAACSEYSCQLENCFMICGLTLAASLICCQQGLRNQSLDMHRALAFDPNYNPSRICTSVSNAAACTHACLDMYTSTPLARVAIQYNKYACARRETPVTGLVWLLVVFLVTSKPPKGQQTWQVWLKGQ